MSRHDDLLAHQELLLAYDAAPTEEVAIELIKDAADTGGGGGGFDAEFYIDYSTSTVYGPISEDSYTMSCVDPESVEVPYACPAAFTANTVGVLVPAGLYTAYGYFAAYGDNLSNMEYWLGAGTYVDEEPDPPYMQTMEIYNVARNPFLDNEGAVSATFRLFEAKIIGVGVGEAWFDTPHDARFKFGILRHAE